MLSILEQNSSPRRHPRFAPVLNVLRKISRGLVVTINDKMVISSRNKSLLSSSSITSSLCTVSTPFLSSILMSFHWKRSDLFVRDPFVIQFNTPPVAPSDRVNFFSTFLIREQTSYRKIHLHNGSKTVVDSDFQGKFADQLLIYSHHSPFFHSPSNFAVR